MSRLPLYKPDASKVELLEERALANDIFLGCQHIYTLEYLGLSEEVRPNGLTMSEIGWALNDSDQWVRPRLEELAKLGLLQPRTIWQTDSDGEQRPVTYWQLTAAGWSVLTVVCEIAPPGPRSRLSGLAV